MTFSIVIPPLGEFLLNESHWSFCCLLSNHRFPSLGGPRHKIIYIYKLTRLYFYQSLPSILPSARVYWICSTPVYWRLSSIFPQLTGGCICGQTMKANDRPRRIYSSPTLWFIAYSLCFGLNPWLTHILACPGNAHWIGVRQRWKPMDWRPNNHWRSMMIFARDSTFVGMYTTQSFQLSERHLHRFQVNCSALQQLNIPMRVPRWSLLSCGTIP